VLRGQRWAALLPAAIAVLSKESALVLPLLAVAVLWPREGRRALRLALPFLGVVAAALAARLVVLGGPGGAGDPPAPLAVRLLQLVSGLTRALVGGGALPDAAAWLAGGGLLLWSIWRARARKLPLTWMTVAVLPLLAAGWVVGARYFYLPAVGVAWLVAEALPPLPALGVAAGLLALGTVGAVQRRAEVADYRARLAAAEEAVAFETRTADPVVVHVRCGIKDLDLALKNRRPLPAALVIPDVPASFVLMPPALSARTHFLRAAPPLPPSGAYHFGAEEVVGLVRREESPDLEEVRRRLPELRIVEVLAGKSKLTWRDVTPR
jgi:hypothetical protein